MSTFGRTFTASVLVALFALLAAPVRADSDTPQSGDTPELVAQAQVTPPAATPEGERKKGVEEIVVTATKREENLQEIPIAVSAFTGDDLAERGIANVEDLQQVAPSLSIYNSNSTSNGGTMRIRGIGTTGNNPGLEAAVGTFIDGVYRSRSGLAFSELQDVERIEVLRGPQGTLFGKNTSAGAVSIITKKPEFEWGGGLEFAAGNLDLLRGSASITGPLVDEKVAMRFSTFWTYRDGFYEDLESSDEFSNLDRKGFKAQLLFTPAPETSFRMIYDWNERHESCCPAVYNFFPTDPTVGTFLRPRFLGAGGTITNGFERNEIVVGTNWDPYEDVSEWGISGELNHEMGEVTLTSITAWRDYRVGRGQDVDFSNVDILQNPDERETFENFSQEVRLTGSAGMLDWLVGGYGYTERYRGNGDVFFGYDADAFLGSAIFAFGDGETSDFKQSTAGWSVFTHNVLNITDQLSFAAGVRYGDERKRGQGSNNGSGPNQIINDDFCAPLPAGNGVRVALCDNPGFEDARREREWAATVNLGYQLTDSLNSYISFSRGYKAGGYNLDNQANDAIVVGGVLTGEFADGIEFDPEFAESYELGAKGRFLDDRLTLNTALFWAKFKDFQLNTFTGLGFFISNLPRVNSQGIEVEGALQIVEGVIFSGGFTYSVSRYADKSSIEEALRDELITQAPRMTGSMALNVEQPIPGTEWAVILGSNAFYRGKHNTGSDLDPQKHQHSIWLLNAQAGVRTPDQRWEILAFGQNLTDKRYKTLSFDSVFQGGAWSTFVGAPRTYGVMAKYRY